MAHKEIKLCLLGDSGVGKSSIAVRFAMNTFKANMEATIGASFLTKTFPVDDKIFKLQIWDTAGQEKYRALAPMYYRGALAAIVVYDITSQPSFHMLQSWISELQKHGSSDIVLAIAGNKSDLINEREVTTSDAQYYAEQVGALFTETSALADSNIHKLFKDVCLKIVELDLDKSRVSHNRIKVGAQDKKKKQSSCCNR